MTSFPILDLVVGVIFFYFLLSIICSSAVEMVMTMANVRAKMLTKWIGAIFTQNVTPPGGKPVQMWQAIVNHCSTSALSHTNSATSYIDARNFTDAILALIVPTTPPPPGVTPLQHIIASIRVSASLPPELQVVFLNYATEAEQTFAAVTTKTASEIDMLKTKMEKWYDSNMERVTGALKKRWARPLTFWISLFIVLLLNADTISIAKYLYSNPTARANAAAQAYAAVKDSGLNAQVEHFRKTLRSNDTTAKSAQQLTDTITARIQSIKGARAALDEVIPLGWNNKVFIARSGKFSIWLVLSKLVGMAVTVLAMTMGAPFWFDILNKIANVRGNGNKPKPQEEAA